MYLCETEPPCKGKNFGPLRYRHSQVSLYILIYSHVCEFPCNEQATSEHCPFPAYENQTRYPQSKRHKNF